MSVSNQQTIYDYIGNDVTVSFSYSCQVQRREDLVITVNMVPVTSGITVTGIGTQSGGNVIFDTAPPSGAAIRIAREVVLERVTDYQQNGDFLARVVNPDFDRLWMALQQFGAKFTRAMRFPDSDVNPQTELPPAAQRANNVLGFDYLGNPKAVIPIEGSAAAVIAELQKPTGADIIGFLQSGTGAQGRTVQSKLREYISVKDFGAEGDGVNDDAPWIEAAVLACANAGGGVVYIPPGTYLLGTTSLAANSHYAYITPRNGVSIIGAGRDQTVLRVKDGENARFTGVAGNGPNIIGTKQATPLSNCIFANFTTDWGATGNLLTNAMGARNNASIISTNGAANVVCDNLRFNNTPGNQCVFFPATSEGGQGNIVLRNLAAVNCGSGLPGNYNQDHSSYYCNGTNLRYENLNGVAPQQVNGTLFELHGSNAVAIGCSSDNYKLGFYIASDFKVIENIKVSNGVHTNCSGSFFLNGNSWKVNDVEVHSCMFKQALGLSTIYPGFITYPQYLGCNSLSIHDCQFIGGGYADGVLMYHCRIENLRFERNECIGFANYGMVSWGFDIGGGVLFNSLYIRDNRFSDVKRAITYNAPALACRVVDISGNTFDRSVSDVEQPINVTFASSRGVIGPNNFSQNYIGGFVRNFASGALTYDYSTGTWTPTLRGSGTIGTGTYTQQTGTYTKIGNRVKFSVTLKWTSHDGVGQMGINLPIPPLSDGTGLVSCSILASGIAFDSQIAAGVAFSSGLLQINQMKTATVLGAPAFAASGELYISGDYPVSP